MYDEKYNQKAFGYQLAFGSVLKKHDYPFWYVGKTWLRALGGSIASGLALDRRKARYHWLALRGRISGWFNYH
jgi:hypothetical protein